jgi:TonB family protein
MSQRLFYIMLKFAAVSLCFFAVVENVPAQSATGTPALEPVVLNKLFPPVYPPLARQARITGDVKMQVTIRQDGSVASVEVISGHPMLKQAAVDSVQKSTFECRRCGEMVTSFPMTYTFGFFDSGGCRWTERVRTSKCLYLWKCGEKWNDPENRAPEVTMSQSHITILVSSVCPQTEPGTAR